MTCYHSVTLIQVKGIYVSVVTVRPSCHNVRQLRRMRNLITSVYPLR